MVKVVKGPKFVLNGSRQAKKTEQVATQFPFSTLKFQKLPASCPIRLAKAPLLQDSLPIANSTISLVKALSRNNPSIGMVNDIANLSSRIHAVAREMAITGPVGV